MYKLKISYDDGVKIVKEFNNFEKVARFIYLLVETSNLSEAVKVLKKFNCRLYLTYKAN